MKCIIPGPNVKVLGRAIHSLAKIGDELYVEFSSKELFFRTVNSSKTAYASYTFSSNFFSFFQSEGSEIEKWGSLTCQISMRSALSIFKSPLALDRMTESAQIQFQANSDKLIFILKHKKGVVKIFNVPVIECESLQAYYHKDSFPNSITIQPKIIMEILANFQNNQDEITWKVSKNNIVIKNYSQPEDDSSGIKTEICVDKGEFSGFKIENETEVTFCLKELRAVLLFSDSVSLPLIANFSTSSKPMLFVVKSEIFEVHIVASTLSGDSFSLDSVSASKSSNCVSHQSTHETNNLNVEQLVMSDQEEPENVDQLDQPLNVNQLEVPQCNSQGTSCEKNTNPVSQKTGRQVLKQVFSKYFSEDPQDFRTIPGYEIILASDSDSDSNSDM